ncbi:MAG: glycosyltransferase family 2 protein [Chitinophagaceae bacterium]|nr:glycosyltransferase family 2 protein [Chitinophagaceae bacterium]
MTQVSIIIINYNTFQLTSNCIQSIIEYTKGVKYEIILVDNASNETNPELFQEKFPSIKLIKNPENSGFAKGNNLGIEQANGEFILLLNSDTYLVEDAISKTYEYAKSIKDIGVFGCKMIFENGKIQHTARKFRSISWELLDAFRILLYLFPYRMRAQLMLGKYFRADYSTVCDWLNGAFFMFPKSILSKLPNKMLDDRFFMYGEDHLWCWQFKQLGHSAYFYHDTKIVHINNGSTSKTKQLNLRTLMLKHELEIMKYRKGEGLYYYLFKIIYSVKEKSRIFILGLNN